MCGDVAVGGLSLNGFPFRKDSGIALLGLNSAGQPWITWASGPNGITSYGADKLMPRSENSDLTDRSEAPKVDVLEPTTLYAKVAINTVDDVVAFGTGPGTEALHGTLDNTAIFKIIRDEL